MAEKDRWYDAYWFMVTMILLFGPFALPLVFKNKKISKRSKVIITILVLFVTIYATVLTVEMIQDAMSYYNQLFAI